MNKSIYKIIFYLSLGYIIIVSIFLFYHRVGFSPDQFFVLALLITLILGRMKQFIRDWSPPVLLFLSYDYLRGLVPKLSMEVNIFPMIDFDRLVFGGIPTNQLQALLFLDGRINWYDYVSTLLYMSHFAAPMAVGFILWLKNKKQFQEYILALIILSYAGFITYVLYPAMPPWMAAEQGYIPEVFKVNDRVFASLPHAVDLPSVYRFVGANLVAAVPSLHAAYPLLTFLFIRKYFKRLGLLLIPYVGGVWFAVIYLGEHYVFDILIGVIYVFIIFALMTKGKKLWNILGSGAWSNIKPVVYQKVFVTKEFFRRRSKP